MAMTMAIMVNFGGTLYLNLSLEYNYEYGSYYSGDYSNYEYSYGDYPYPSRFSLLEKCTHRKLGYNYEAYTYDQYGYGSQNCWNLI